MKIICLIDSLCSGGAERQLTELAIGLHKRNHNTTVLYYHKPSFYLDVLKREGVDAVQLNPSGMWEKFRQIRSWINAFNPDIVQAYLTGPSALAVLTNLPFRHWKVVVSERFLPIEGYSSDVRLNITRKLYYFADWVVTNSHNNLTSIIKSSRNIERKSSVIWNCVDLQKFHPAANPKIDDIFQFICVASLYKRKNGLRVIDAVKLLLGKCKIPFHLKWVGNIDLSVPEIKDTFMRMQKLINDHHLENIITLAGESNDVTSELQSSDAFLLASLSEGLPNAVCEAMACGLPVVASAVSDVPLLVKEGRNGFLCAPNKSESIANAMLKMLEISSEVRIGFGKTSRKIAEETLDKDRFINEYEELFHWLLMNKH